MRSRNPRNVPPINENIRFPEIRLISDDGAQLGIMPPREALQLAAAKDLDLVLVSDKATPPVCRIINYGKYNSSRKSELERPASDSTTSK